MRLVDVITGILLRALAFVNALSSVVRPLVLKSGMYLNERQNQKALDIDVGVDGGRAIIFLKF